MMILSHFKHGLKRTTHFMIITLGKMTNITFLVLKPSSDNLASDFPVLQYGIPFINLALQKKPANFPSQRRLNNFFYWEYFEMVITFLDDILFPSFSIHFQRCRKTCAV